MKRVSWAQRLALAAAGVYIGGVEAVRREALPDRKREDGETRMAPTHASVRLDANQRMREWQREHGEPEVQAEAIDETLFDRHDYGDDGEGWVSIGFKRNTVPSESMT